MNKITKKELLNELNITSNQDVIFFATNKKKYKKIIIKKKSKKRTVYRITNNKTKNFEKKLLKIIKKYAKKDLDLIKYNFAYQKDKSIVDNAMIHVGNSCIYKIDIEDYFESIKFNVIVGTMQRYFERDASIFIAQCSCVIESNGQGQLRHSNLAQGNRLSPIISNLCSRHIDIFFHKKLKDFPDVVYSRYSDDMTFSSNDKMQFEKFKKCFNPQKFKEDTKFFKINKSKTFSSNSKHGKKKVTGLIVNEKINIEDSYYRKLRNDLYRCKKDFNQIISEYMNNVNITEKEIKKFESIMHGKINYCKNIKGDRDSRVLKLVESFNSVKEFDIKFDNRDIYQKSILKVHTENSTGTMFIVEDFGLVTNYHVIDRVIKGVEESFVIEFYKIENGQIFLEEILLERNELLGNLKYNLKMDLVCIDLKILSPHINFNKIFHKLKCDMSPGSLASNNEISLYGFENGIISVDQVNCAKAKILSTGISFDYEHIIIDKKFEKGASGGPILNDKNDVVGVYYKIKTTGLMGAFRPFNLFLLEKEFVELTR